MIFRLLIAAVVTMAGVSGMPTEYFGSESFTPPENAESEKVYFTETGQYLEGELLEFWREHGGVPVFGFPITGEVERKGVAVQYFERAVLEIHPQNPPDWRILLRRLGEEAAGPSHHRISAFQPGHDTGDGKYFEETGHAISPRFLDHWEKNGGLRVFGYPISAEFESNGLSVQYFERAVFRFYPDNHPDWRILQPRLGEVAAVVDGASQAVKQYDESVATYFPGIWGQGGAGPVDLVVYLTFDDGPHGVWTPQVLDILRTYNARATFFVLGQYTALYPDIIQDIASDGHSIANHSYDHASMAGMSFSEFKRQIRETEKATNHPLVPCMRPPYGAIDANTKGFASQLGYEIVLWDIDPRDWERPGAQVIADRILNNVKPGDVILLHDGGGERSQSIRALEITMKKLSERGYRFEALCQ